MLYSYVSAAHRTDQLMTFNAKRMSELCDNRGISEADLAKQIGVSKQTLYRYKAGTRSGPTPEILTKMAEALGTTADYLLGLVDEPRPSGGLSDDEWTILLNYRERRAALQREIINQEIAELDDPIRDAVKTVISHALKVQRKFDSRRNNP